MVRYNSLSKTYNEYVPLDLSTFGKFKQYDGESLLGIMRYGEHPVQWISIIGTISSVESILLVDVATLADDTASTTTLKCAWSFPACSTQPISDYLKHLSPKLRLGGQYQYCPPMAALQPEMGIVATGRLGKYNGQACLHLYYIHHLSADNAADFRLRAAEYKEIVLDRPRLLASRDKISVSPSYEETLIRILQDPAAEGIVDFNSNARPALDWRCPNQACSKSNHSYCRNCVWCKHRRPVLPMLPPCCCWVCKLADGRGMHLPDAQAG